MRIYFDTEFTTLDALAENELISAGFVAENGREWYVELTDFRYSECSPFVREAVLPLLGEPGVVHLTAEEFGPRLSAWLSAFGEPIDLVTDYPGDWYLLNDYARFSHKSMNYPVRAQIWQRSGEPAVEEILSEAEVAFWLQYPGKQHHALYDARRLKVLAEQQAVLRRTIAGGNT